MKSACTLHPLLTGFSLYELPMPWRFMIKKKRSVQSEVDDLIEAGVEHIEIVSDIISFTPEFMRAFRRKDMKYLESLKDQGITFSVHINHIGYSFPTHYKYMRHNTIEQFQFFVRYYASLAPTHYTLHPGPDEIFKGHDFKDLPTKKTFSFRRFKMVEHGLKPLVIEELLKNAPHAFKGLKEIIGVNLDKIYIENPEGMNRKEYDALFGPLSKMVPELGCLLDVGHLQVEEYYRNKRCVEDFVEYWGGKKKKLKAVHIHDTVPADNKNLLMRAVDDINYAKERLGDSEEKLGSAVKKIKEYVDLHSELKCHQKLGSGVLNLQSLLKKLKQVNFQGPVIFEGGDPNTILDSVKLLTKEIEKTKKEVSDD